MTARTNVVASADRSNPVASRAAWLVIFTPATNSIVTTRAEQYGWWMAGTRTPPTGRRMSASRRV